MFYIKLKTDFLLDISVDSKLLKKVMQFFSKTSKVDDSTSYEIDIETDSEEAIKEGFTKSFILSTINSANSSEPGEDDNPPSPTPPDEDEGGN